MTLIALGIQIFGILILALMAFATCAYSMFADTFDHKKAMDLLSGTAFGLGLILLGGVGHLANIALRFF